MPTDTLGRLLIDAALPPGVVRPPGPLNSKNIKDLYQQLAERSPDQYTKITKDLSDLSVDAAHETGGYSFGPEHLRPTEEISAAQQAFRAAVAQVLATPNLSDKQRNDRLVHVALEHTAPLQDAVTTSAARTNNPLHLQVSSGSKGKPENLKSLMAGDTLYTDSEYQPVPFPVTRSFYEGLSPAQYYGGTFGARTAIILTKLGTAQGGFAAKRLRNVTHRLVVSGEDDPDPHPDDPATGFRVPLSDPDNEGAVLAAPVAGYPRNTVLSRKVLGDLKRQGTEHVVVRSPMVGGPADGGVYSRDAGIRDKGRLAPMGDQIGMQASDSLSEPMTQTIIGCLAAGTTVRMADGTEKSIESVDVGDMVLGSDLSGTTLPVRVVRLFDNGTRTCRRFVFGPSRSVICTADHKMLTFVSEVTPNAVHGRMEVVRVGEFVIHPSIRRVAVIPGGDGDQIEESGFVSSTEVGDVPTYDIEVDHPAHLFALANGLVVSNSKHSGGVAGATKGQQGFPVMDRMLSPSSEYPGATHAERDGLVTAITDAPHGGKFVTVDGHEHHVGPDYEPTVKAGDTVEAGDPLSDGPENPAKYVEHKGIGEARKRFVSAFMKVANDSGFRPHRRNLELVARGLIDSVEMQGESEEHAPGDVVSYTSLAANYRPRDGHVRVSPKEAIGKFLERPAAHFSIGTRVSPRVAADLTDHGISQIPVHHAPPPFTPVMVRSHSAIDNDHDWMTRMLGSNLERNLLKGTVRGDVSDPTGTSWASALSQGTGFGDPGTKTRGWDSEKLADDHGEDWWGI